MRVIAGVLATLPNDASRARVLRAAGADVSTVSRPAPANGGSQQASAGSCRGRDDVMLTVGKDLLDTPHQTPNPAGQKDDLVIDMPSRITDPIHGDDLSLDASVFADQRIECDTAALAIDLRDIDAHRTDSPFANGGLESLIREFVADFQRLALEWKTASYLFT